MSSRTGQQYMDRLRDGRRVWLAGERVADVTKHSVFAASVKTIAWLYDLQHDSGQIETLTRADEESEERMGLAFVPPRSREQLVRRRHAFKAVADATCGLMGRSPDFLNTAVTAFAQAAEYFGQVDPRFAGNITRYYEYCRRNDLFLSHATINPATDRSRGSSEQSTPATHLRIIGESAEGPVVRGAKMIGTLVPTADELIVFPLPGYRAGDEPYTAAFAIPVDTEGLHVVCREPFGGLDGKDAIGHPLARFDEMDATVIFDDVVVPWDRLFFRGDVRLANKLYDATTARHHTGHHGVVRGLAKAELLVGIAIRLAESAGTSSFLHVQEMLGESIGLLELARGAVLLAEERATMSRWGTLTPDISPIQALRYHYPRFCGRLIEVIQLLGGGSLLAAPHLADLEPLNGPDIAPYFRGAGSTSAVDRVRLLKLAWDVGGDSFGQRQLQYERYHAGDPVRLAAQHYLAYDAVDLRAAVDRALSAP
ncbi:4-hydroxyphenylacetate 3-hydroxylase family protein [Nonomuraea rubra]